MTIEQLIEEGYHVSDSFRGEAAKEEANTWAQSIRNRGFKTRVKRDGDIYRVYFKRKERY